MANYPERPLRKGRPKSTHSGSKKGRTWLQAPGQTDRIAAKENHSLATGLVRIGHLPKGMDSFLKSAAGRGKIPVGVRQRPGARPYTV